MIRNGMRELKAGFFFPGEWRRFDVDRRPGQRRGRSLAGDRGVFGLTTMVLFTIS